MIRKDKQVPGGGARGKRSVWHYIWILKNQILDFKGFPALGMAKKSDFFPILTPHC
jgi:hypothetical protein